MTVPIKISPESFVSELMLMRDKYNGSFLIVEGDTDARLFERLKYKKCKIRAVGGKYRAIKVTMIMEKRNFQGALTIVDADFDHIEGYEYDNKNLHRTDTYDLDSMMINSPALEKLLSEKTNRNKLREFTSSMDIRSKLLCNAKKIAFLRLLALRKKWRLSFKELNFKNFIDKRTLNISENSLIKAVLENSKNASQSFEQIQKELELIKLELTKSEKVDPWLICNGHDMLEILNIGYQNIFGLYCKNLNEKELGTLLRLAYESNFFKNTTLYNNIIQWEKANFPFKIINDEL